MSHEFLDGLRADFRQFLIAHWQYHGLDRVAPLGPVELDIAAFMQHGPNLRGVLALRELGKSFIAAAYACWRLLCEPKTKIILLSESQGISKNNLNQVKTWVRTTPWLRHLAPRRESKERDGATEFDVAGVQIDTKNPSVAALGITGQITGRRADLIIPDDVETPNTSMTQTMRQELRKRVGELTNIIFKKTGEILYLGTPQHEETIYGDLAEFTFQSWPIKYPDPEEEQRLAAPLAPSLKRNLADGKARPGDPTVPARFGADIIPTIEARGRSVFAMQFMLQKHLADAAYYPLKLSDLIVYDCHRDLAPPSIIWGTTDNKGSTRLEGLRSVGFGSDGYYRPILFDQGPWLPYSGVKMYVDPAGGGRDEMAWSIVAHLHGILYLLHVGAYRGPNPSGDECLNKLVADAKKFRARQLYIETNFGGNAIIELLKPKLKAASVLPGVADDFPGGWAANIEGVHSSGMKEERIVYALQPVMNQHRLVVDRRIIESDLKVEQKYSLFHQLTRIIDPSMAAARGCLAHDDRLESLAGAVQQWTESLAQDPQTRAANLQAERMKKEIKNWGRRNDAPATWFKL